MKLKIVTAIASVTLLIPQAGSGQTITQAESFVRHVYAAYEHPTSERNGDYLWKGAPLVFSSSLVGLIHMDQHNTPKGYVGKLDFDPICACQDSDGLKLTALTIKAIGSGRAIVNVALHYPEPAEEQLQLDLLWTPAGWRIDDIESKKVSSLRKFLR